MFKQKIYRTLFFLVINFFGLYLGGLATADGVNSDWYSSLRIAPWTPPGWVFGTAWTLIMICYSIYMGSFAGQKTIKTWIPLFTIQFILNVSWNFIFFKYHEIFLSLVVIIALYILVLLSAAIKMKPALYRILLIPYAIWMIIATSLNAYIYVYN